MPKTSSAKVPIASVDPVSDMVMLNDLDRFRLVVDVVDRVPGLAASGAHLRDEMEQARLEARAWTREHGEDLPAIRDWTWPY